MARDTHASSIKKWGETGATEDFVTAPETLRKSGYTDDYSPPGTKQIEREYLNDIFRKLTALGKEINSVGILEYSNQQDYVVNAVVNYSGQLYMAVVITGPTTANATTPGTNEAIWKQITARQVLPSKVTGVAATTDNTQIELNWTCPLDGGAIISKYGIRWKPSANSNYDDSDIVETLVTRTNHTITDLVNGTAYDFQVRAYNAVGWGPYSDVVAATPTAQAPDTPINVGAFGLNESVRLKWHSSTQNGGTNDVTYRIAIRRSTDAVGVVWKQQTTTDTEAIITGLTNGSLYYFSIRAEDNGGNSAYSNEASATPVVQFKTFTASNATFRWPWNTSTGRAILTSGQGGQGGAGGGGGGARHNGANGAGGAGGYGRQGADGDAGTAPTSSLSLYRTGSGGDGGAATNDSIASITSGVVGINASRNEAGGGGGGGEAGTNGKPSTVDVANHSSWTSGEGYGGDGGGGGCGGRYGAEGGANPRSPFSEATQGLGGGEGGLIAPGHDPVASKGGSGKAGGIGRQAVAVIELTGLSHDQLLPIVVGSGGVGGVGGKGGKAAGAISATVTNGSDGADGANGANGSVTLIPTY